MFRRAASALPPLAWAWLLCMLPVLAQALLQHGTLPFGVPDSDGWVRLAIVRDWLNGGSWYDHHYASNAPFAPATSPWTRPLDVVIALLVKLQPGVAMEAALDRAALLLPMLWTGLVAAAVLACVRHVRPAPASYFATALVLVVMGATPIARNYFGVGNADHHGLLAAVWAWACYQLLRMHTGWYRPACLGALLALMLWVSPEAIALLALAYGWLGVCWLAGHGDARPLARTATVAALGTTLALLVERPMAQWFAPLHDTVAIGYVSAMLLAALGAWALVVAGARAWWVRMALAAGVAVLAALAQWAIDPRFFAGPMVDVTPFIRNEFLGKIGEAKPMLEQPFAQVLAALIQPLAALWVLVRCARHEDGVIAPRAAALLLVLTLGALALYAVQIRFYYYLFPMAALVLGVWLAAWLRPESFRAFWPAARLCRRDEAQRVRLRLPLLFLLLAAPMLLILTGLSGTDAATLARYQCRVEARRLIQQGVLAPLSPRIILAHTDMGGEILWRSKHRILAGNYHREGPAIATVWHAFATTDRADFMATLRTHRVGAMLICPDGDVPEAAIATRLYHGAIALPGWQRVALPEARPHSPALYRKQRP